MGYCISLTFLIRQKTITCDTLFSLWIPLYHCDDDKVEDDCNAANPAVISSRLHLRPKPLPPSPSRCDPQSTPPHHLQHHGVEFDMILSRRHHHQLHHCPGYPQDPRLTSPTDRHTAPFRVLLRQHTCSQPCRLFHKKSEESPERVRS